jgi:hypothetical protein
MVTQNHKTKVYYVVVNKYAVRQMRKQSRHNSRRTILTFGSRNWSKNIKEIGDRPANVICGANLF